jgi:hypothetical protein
MISPQYKNKKAAFTFVCWLVVKEKYRNPNMRIELDFGRVEIDPLDREESFQQSLPQRRTSTVLGSLFRAATSSLQTL